MARPLLLLLLVCGLCVISGTTSGQIYKWVDEKGTVHFSDDPSFSDRSRENQTSKEDAIEIIKRSEDQKLKNFKPKFLYHRSETERLQDEKLKAIKEANERNEELIKRKKDLIDSQNKIEKLMTRDQQIKNEEKEKRRIREEEQQRTNAQHRKDNLPREWEVHPVPGGAWDDKGNFYTKTPGGYFDPKSGKWLPK